MSNRQQSEQMAQAFVEQLGRRHKAREPFVAKVSEVFRHAGNFAVLVDGIRNDRNLTADGKQAKIRETLKQGYMGWIDDIAKSADSSRGHLAKLRREIGPVFDKADVVAEMQRAEVRAYVRSLPVDERTTLGLTADKMVQEAIMAAPAILSGMPEDVYGHMVQGYLEKHHPNELKVIEDLAHEVEVIDAAAVTAKQNILFNSGLTDDISLQQAAEFVRSPAHMLAA